MGIVVCISMLLGLAVLQPTPWDSSKRGGHAPKFILFAGAALLGFGAWNVLYAYFKLDGFWSWMSLISGVAMVVGSYYIFSEQGSNISDEGHIKNSGASGSRFRKAVVAVLSLSFLLYALTPIQLNLGYPILG